MLKRIVTKEGYELVDTVQAANAAGVHPQTIAYWRRAGYLRPIAAFTKMFVYDLAEVMRASLAPAGTKPRGSRKDKT